MQWDGVSAILARHDVVAMDERSLVVSVRANGHAVRLRAERVQAFDEDWLLVMAPVCPEARASWRDALASNMNLALAAHALEQGWHVLRATHALATLDAAGLERIVRFLSEEAVRLRAIYVPDGETVERALGHYGE